LKRRAESEPETGGPSFSLLILPQRSGKRKPGLFTGRTAHDRAMDTSELFEILKTKAEEAKPNLPAGFSAVAQVELTGPDPARWRLSAAEGRLTLAEEGAAAEPPDLRVTLAAETAAGIYLKTMNPLMAFMTGKIKVKGDPVIISTIKQLLTKGR